MVTGKPFGISKIGARIMSIITVGGHEVTRNLSEPSDQTIMHIDVYADYLSGISPQTTSRALRALLMRGGSKSVRVDSRYTEAYGPHEVMLNIDGINIYTKTMITCDEDLIGQIYVGKEELKVRSIGHCAMLEEDAMHIGTEADVTGHVLDISGKKTQLRGLLDTGAVLSVIPIETWEKMGFDKGDLIDSRIRLSAANKGALRVLGRTPIIALNLGERNLWMSFIVVENLDESDQFILGRDFIRNFDVTIDLNNAMFRIRNPDRRYAIKPVNLIMANENKAPVFLSRRVRLKANEAAIVSLRMKNYNELSDNKQVCIVPNPNSQSAAVLGRSFSITKSGLCVSVLLNTLDIPITIQRRRKLGYALPVKFRYETIENSKQNEVVDCPNHRDKICILRRLQKIKDSSGLIKSLKSETDDGLSSCSNFPERPTLDEMQNEKPVLPEIEHLRGKLKDEQLEAIKEVLERNEEVFSRHKADIGCCNFVEHEIELEENAVPHREGARRMTPHKSDACRKEIETQLMSFLGFANYYREFIKGYADKVYPMQQLMRHKGKKFTWNNAAEESFQRIKKELCEAPVLGMPTEKGMYVLDTDASVVAISGILHQEQEWNGKTVLRPIAYGSKVLSDTEMKYGAPKAEMFAVVTFVEKYRAYLGSEPFKLRVDNRALSWLKTYSMDQSYIGRWIVRLDGYNMIIEHRTRDKHQNADSLSKKTEFYERQEQREADRPEIKDGFSFMNKETYDSLPLTRWLDKSGKPIEDHPELPKEPPEKTILRKSKRIPIEIILKSKIVKETLKAKGYDLSQVEAGTAQIDDDLMRLLEKLSDDKPVIQEKGQEKPEFTILRRKETVNDTDSSRGSVTDSKDVVRSLVDKIPEDILEQTKVRKKKVTFKEDTEHLGLGQESGECSRFTEEGTGEGKLSGEREGWDEDSDESSENQDSLCMILAEEKTRHHDRELQTDPSSGTYNMDIQEMRGGEELEKMAVARKPFRELS